MLNLIGRITRYKTESIIIHEETLYGTPVSYCHKSDLTIFYVTLRTYNALTAIRNASIYHAIPHGYYSKVAWLNPRFTVYIY